MREIRFRAWDTQFKKMVGMIGCSRGEVPIERGEGFEEQLTRLFDAYAPKRDNGWREYGEEFTNDTFEVHSYYWGDCTCGWDSLDDGHKKESELKHSKDCYQNDYHRIYELCKSDFDKERVLIRDVYKKLGWDTTSPDWWHGCAIRCSCDYHDRLGALIQQYAEKFGCDGHKEDCLLLRPNFQFKPTGYKLMWYKYPLRDSYANQKLTLKQFEVMIDKCIASIGK